MTFGGQTHLRNPRRPDRYDLNRNDIQRIRLTTPGTNMAFGQIARSRENMTAKLWLSPVRVSFNLGFSRHELRRIERLVSENERKCLKAWNDYFGT